MANAKYEVKEDGESLVVFRDEIEVATYNAESGLQMAPNKKKLLKTAVAQVARHLGIQNDAVKVFESGEKDAAPDDKSSLKGSPEPDVTKLQLGDKAPIYIEWFKANKSAKEFSDKYGHRKIPR